MTKAPSKRRDPQTAKACAAIKRATNDVEKWLAEQGAVESRTFDEETGRPMRTFTIDLTKEK